MPRIRAADLFLLLRGQKSQPFLAAGHVAVAGVLTDEQRIGRVHLEMPHQRRDHQVAVIVGGIPPELGKNPHQPAANGVGMAAIGGPATHHAGTDRLGRLQVLGAEHQAIPVVRNFPHKLPGKRWKILNGVGIVLQHQQRAHAVVDGRIEHRAMG